MSLTATYDGVLSRIRLAGTLLGATATYAVFERTVNGGITWTTIRGGGHVTVSGENAGADDYEWEPGVATTYRVTSYSAADVQQAQFSAVITQDLPAAWLKVPAAPFLNMPVIVVDRGPVSRRSRAGLFEIVGRSDPVAVGDVASSVAYELQLLTQTAADKRDLDYLFASGEILFLQLPAAAADLLPGGYFVVTGDPSRVPTMRLSPRRVWTIPLRRVAAPGPEVIGSAYTWASAVAQYATWSALIADNASWSALLQRVGSPSDVIVP